jgi:hypothetical protein
MKAFLMNLDIPITIALFLLVLFSLFIATKSIVTDDRLKDYKRLTKYARALLVIDVIMLCILIGQHYHNKFRAIIKEQEYQIKQNTRDSLVKVRYDSLLFVMKSTYDADNIKTITTVADVLGKYGYKLDTANRRLVSILKESPKTKVIRSNDPVLSCSAFIYANKQEKILYIE